MTRNTLNKIIHFSGNLMTHICLFTIAMMLWGCGDQSAEAFKAMEQGKHMPEHAIEIIQREEEYKYAKLARSY